MFYDLETNTNSSSNELKSHMEDFILIIIMSQQRVLVWVKNMCWIFVQNPIQMDLVQYKDLHMPF